MVYHHGWQMVLCVHSLVSISGDMIVSTVQDVLLFLSLNNNNCHGQFYDGASNMSGSKTIQQQITIKGFTSKQSTLL